MKNSHEKFIIYKLRVARLPNMNTSANDKEHNNEN